MNGVIVHRDGGAALNLVDELVHEVLEILRVVTAVEHRVMHHANLIRNRSDDRDRATPVARHLDLHVLAHPQLGRHLPLIECSLVQVYNMLSVFDLLRQLTGNLDLLFLNLLAPDILAGVTVIWL
jgi:hypothetical protein